MVPEFKKIPENTLLTSSSFFASAEGRDLGPRAWAKLCKTNEDKNTQWIGRTRYYVLRDEILFMDAPVDPRRMRPALIFYLIGEIRIHIDHTRAKTSKWAGDLYLLALLVLLFFLLTEIRHILEKFAFDYFPRIRCISCRIDIFSFSLFYLFLLSPTQSKLNAVFLFKIARAHVNDFSPFFFFFFFHTREIFFREQEKREKERAKKRSRSV